MKIAKKIIIYILIIAMCFCLVSCIKSCYEYTTYTDTVEYELMEFGDGVYGYYNAVTSSIPAENYDMITLCFNNKVYTLKGDVNVYYTDEAAKLIWTDTNIVNGDTFDVYVPFGSIQMRPNLVQS